MIKKYMHNIYILILPLDLPTLIDDKIYHLSQCLGIYHLSQCLGIYNTLLLPFGRSWLLQRRGRVFACRSSVLGSIPG